jgi:hypothetical protein
MAYVPRNQPHVNEDLMTGLARPTTKYNVLPHTKG